MGNCVRSRSGDPTNPAMPPPYSLEQILIACALKKELEALRTSLPEPLQFLRTGLGCRRTCRRLERKIREAPPGAIIFAGTAGQLSPDLTSGQVVFPEQWCFPDGRCYGQTASISSFLAARGWSPRGLGLTVRRPVLTGNRRRLLHQETAALVCDMEGAGVLALGQKLGVPTVAIKVVSDTAESGITGYWRELSTNLQALADYLGGVIRALSGTPS